ncbi:unnamed protein product [Cuscuta campestris]|uniref:Meiosis-specific protein ASY3-like coiled-coil domain-containing protein n=2 Tax=Cuscuta sect. Cleistogrammica TaxID=1824901 RepID=A0A484MKK1_9ASTE|nr:hypothetical protein DM860_002944 [Cuscuta australis]VFQ89501.1 unnamed protein product [Cuscuta campestris]
MSAAKSSAKKRVLEPEQPKSEVRKRVILEEDFDADLSEDISVLMTALKQIKEKAHKDDRKKNEETISSGFSEIRANIEDVKSKFEKERQNFTKALSKSSKECENLLKNESAKFQAIYEKFIKDKTTHLQTLKDSVSKFEEEKLRLFTRYEQQRKKEKNMLSELEKDTSKRLAEIEESLKKKKKQDDKTFSTLRKKLGSFLDNASDEDFLLDE